MQYARIVDKGECMSTLHNLTQFPWPAPFLKEVANRTEWAKHDFYPSNDLVGEVPYIIKQDWSRMIAQDVYILLINQQFWVPMTIKGIVFISQEEYEQSRPNNIIRGMDERQERINAFNWDSLTKPKFSQHNVLLDLDADIYCRATYQSVVQHASPARITSMAMDLLRQGCEEWSLNALTSNMVEWVKKDVTASGWELTDKDGVSWWIGLYAMAYTKTRTDNLHPFDEIFKNAYILYFKQNPTLWRP